MNAHCSHRPHACMKKCVDMCMEVRTQILNANEPTWPPQEYRVHLPTHTCVMPVCAREPVPQQRAPVAQPTCVCICVYTSRHVLGHVYINRYVCVVSIHVCCCVRTRTTAVICMFVCVSCTYVRIGALCIYSVQHIYICVHVCILDAYKSHARPRARAHTHTHEHAPP